MDKLLEDVSQYVEKNIGDFHRKRIDSLDKLKLSKVLARKNPYLFKAKYILTAEGLVKGLVDAHISSHEETIFGNWLERLAIYVNGKVYQGRKSGITGIDLEFERGETRYIVSIKSGPNWGNSSQIKKMIDDFKKARRIMRQANSDMNIVSVNGCCYGRVKNFDQDEYLKYCGQKFWEFISGNKNLYIDIINPLGNKAKEKNKEFIEMYCQMLNKFTFEFMKRYCDESGAIAWEKLVEFNSSAVAPSKRSR